MLDFLIISGLFVLFSISSDTFLQDHLELFPYPLFSFLILTFICFLFSICGSSIHHAPCGNLKGKDYWKLPSYRDLSDKNFWKLQSLSAIKDSSLWKPLILYGSAGIALGFDMDHFKSREVIIETVIIMGCLPISLLFVEKYIFRSSTIDHFYPSLLVGIGMFCCGYYPQFDHLDLSASVFYGIFIHAFTFLLIYKAPSLHENHFANAFALLTRILPLTAVSFLWSWLYSDEVEDMVMTSDTLFSLFYGSLVLFGTLYFAVLIIRKFSSFALGLIVCFKLIILTFSHLNHFLPVFGTVISIIGGILQIPNDRLFLPKLAGVSSKKYVKPLLFSILFVTVLIFANHSRIPSKVDLVYILNLNPDREHELVDHLNSLDFYKSSCQVHMHVVTTTPISSEAFLKWNKAQNSKSYDFHFYEPRPELIVPNGFRDAFSIVKSFPDDVLPNTLNTAIFVDFDTLFAGDVCEMPLVFDTFDAHQILGAAPEVSSWYSNAELGLAYLLPPPYNSSFTGLNGGVVFLWLERMRQFEWTAKVQEFLKTGPNLPLSDQDILNQMGYMHSDLIKVVPPRYNWQTISGPSCERQPKDVFLFHGNAGSMFPILKQLWAAFSRKQVSSYAMNPREKKAFLAEIMSASCGVGF